VLGSESLPAAAIGVIITACLTFAVAIIFLEFGAHGGGQLKSTLKKTLYSLFKNPLVLAPIFGVFFSLFNSQMPIALDEFLSILGASSAPIALFTIGLFLAFEKQSIKLQSTTVKIVFCKLIIHPLIAFILVFYIFDLPA